MSNHLDHPYFTLAEASDEQFSEAKSEAERWMKDGKGNLFYNDSKGVARLAVIEYILFLKGLRVKRKE